MRIVVHCREGARLPAHLSDDAASMTSPHTMRALSNFLCDEPTHHVFCPHTMCALSNFLYDEPTHNVCPFKLPL